MKPFKKAFHIPEVPRGAFPYWPKISLEDVSCWEKLESLQGKTSRERCLVVGSGAGRRGRVISEGMTVPGEGGEKCSEVEMGVRQRWVTPQPPVVERLNHPLLGLCGTQSSLRDHVFPKKGKISHKSNKKPVGFAFSRTQAQTPQMMVVLEQEGFS